MVGFVDVGDINTHLHAFEQSLSEDHDHKSKETLATSMLVFMVKGLLCSFKYPYAQFPTQSVSSDELFEPFWECVSRLERLGFKVMGLCCDGLAANRRLFSLNSDDHQLPYKVLNPFSEDKRYLYFISDPPHLIKTARNALANGKRHLWVCIIYMIMLTIMQYYYMVICFHNYYSMTNRICSGPMCVLSTTKTGQSPSHHHLQWFTN